MRTVSLVLAFYVAPLALVASWWGAHRRFDEIGAVESSRDLYYAIAQHGGLAVGVLSLAVALVLWLAREEARD